MPDSATIIKRRAEALVMQAQMNAKQNGGDAATAAADLMVAFVLLAVKCGARPEAARDAMWHNATVVVADFWPSETIN